MTKYLIIFALLTTAACNTMEGMGQDIQQGGENIENSADKNK